VIAARHPGVRTRSLNQTSGVAAYRACCRMAAACKSMTIPSARRRRLIFTVGVASARLSWRPHQTFVRRGWLTVHPNEAMFGVSGNAWRRLNSWPAHRRGGGSWRRRRSTYRVGLSTAAGIVASIVNLVATVCGWLLISMASCNVAVVSRGAGIVCSASYRGCSPAIARRGRDAARRGRIGNAAAKAAAG